VLLYSVLTCQKQTSVGGAQHFKCVRRAFNAHYLIDAGATASSSASLPDTSSAVQDADIAAQTASATALGQPGNWLVAFRVSEEQVAAHTQALAQSASLPPDSAAAVEIEARSQAYAAVKTKVLGLAAAEAVASGSTLPTGTAPAPASPSLQVLADYSHLPVTYVSISSAAELARLRADPDVLSVSPNRRVKPAASAALELIGQPAVAARKWAGSGTVLVIDSGKNWAKHTESEGAKTLGTAPVCSSAAGNLLPLQWPAHRHSINACWPSPG
jgi:hypothetical protein